MDDFSLDHPGMLHLLWTVPALWGFCLWGFAKKRQTMQRFATPNLLSALIPRVSVHRQRVRALLSVAAVGLLVAAMAGPRWGTHYEVVPLRGIDIMFVLDASNSMLAEDVAPSRLQRAKLDIRDMLTELRNDRIGLVTFSGNSVLTCPLTVNHGSFLLALDAVNTSSAPRGGTNIGDAVRHAANSFTDTVMDHKAIIVISDGGETDESYAVEAARNVFRKQGIRVFAVGCGDMTKGAPIPIMTDGRRTTMTHQGEEVSTRLDATLLQAMAGAADGGYFANTDFRAMWNRIRPKVTPRDFESGRREVRYPRFHWFAGVALVLLTFQTLMTDRKAVGSVKG